MSTAPQDAAGRLLAQLRAARRRTVEVEPGKALVYLRPTEEEVMLLALRRVSIQTLAIRGLEGWEGVTEADLLGAAIGSTDLAPFTPELAAAVLADRASTWQTALFEHLAHEVEIFMTQRGLMPKSLSPTLQPSVAPATAELASKGA